jgi:hypothetical protein
MVLMSFVKSPIACFLAVFRNDTATPFRHGAAELSIVVWLSTGGAQQCSCRIDPSEDGTSELATYMRGAIGGTRKNKEAIEARPRRHLSGV